MAINFNLHDPGRPIDLLRDIGEMQQFHHQSQTLARQDAVRQAMQAAVDPATGKVDNEAIRRAYVAGGDIDSLLEHDRYSAAAVTAQQKAARENYQSLAGIVANVRDEPSYQRARAVAARLGIDTDFLPPNYTPEAVEEARMLLDATREPEKPTTLERNFEFLQRRDPALGEQYLRSEAQGPLMAIEGFDASGNPTKTFVPRGAIGGGAPPSVAPPAEAVSELRAGRGTPEQFDAIFGAGAAARAMGGAPSQGGATFP